MPHITRQWLVRLCIVAAMHLIPAIASAGLSWDSLEDYSGTQGYHDWSYQYWDITDGLYHDMTWGVRDRQVRQGWPLDPLWFAPVGYDEYCIIDGDGMHPLQAGSPPDNVGARELHSARVWTAPADMQVRVDWSIVDTYLAAPAAGPDGIWASVILNGTHSWDQHVEYQTLVPVTGSADFSVSAGDRLYFEVASGSACYFDHFLYHVDISETTTPELSTWALLACSGLLGVGILRRRRTA